MITREIIKIASDTKNIGLTNKYNFKSSNVIFFEKEMKLISSNKSVLNDGSSNLYKLDNFEYLLNEKLLKGTLIVSSSLFFVN